MRGRWDMWWGECTSLVCDRGRPEILCQRYVSQQIGLIANSSHTGRAHEDSSGGLRCTSKSDTKNGKGKLIGGVIGGLVCLGILLAAFVWFLRRKRRSRMADSTVEPFSEVPSTVVSTEKSSMTMPFMTRMRGVRTNQGSSTTSPSVTNVGTTTDVIDISHAGSNTGEPSTVSEVFQLQIVVIFWSDEGSRHRTETSCAGPFQQRNNAGHSHLRTISFDISICFDIKPEQCLLRTRQSGLCYGISARLSRLRCPTSLRTSLKCLLKPITHQTLGIHIFYFLHWFNLVGSFWLMTDPKTSMHDSLRNVCSIPLFYLTSISFPGRAWAPITN